MPWNPTTRNTWWKEGMESFKLSCGYNMHGSQLPKCSNPQVNKCRKVALENNLRLLFLVHAVCVGGHESASSCMPLCAWRKVRGQPMVTVSLLPLCVCQGQSSGCQQCLYLISKTSHWALLCFLRKLVTVLKQLFDACFKILKLYWRRQAITLLYLACRFWPSSSGI